MRISLNLPVLCLCLIASIATSSTARATVSVSLELPANSPAVGESFDIRIVADLSEAILGWGLDFDVALLAIAVVTDVQIADPWLAASTTDGDELAGVAFPSSISGSHILLATLTLEALAEGSTDLFIGDDHPTDLTEGFALDPSGFDAVEYTPDVLTIVPEPASIGTLGALLVIAAWRHRRHA